MSGIALAPVVEPESEHPEKKGIKMSEKISLVHDTYFYRLKIGKSSSIVSDSLRGNDPISIGAVHIKFCF
jgi:hypothetical protein